MILSLAFNKKFQRVAGGANHQRDPNNTFDSLKALMSASPATTEALRESEVILRVLLSILS